MGRWENLPVWRAGHTMARMGVWRMSIHIHSFLPFICSQSPLRALREGAGVQSSQYIGHHRSVETQRLPATHTAVFELERLPLAGRAAAASRE